MNASPHWAVCRAYSSRVHIVRSEIEKTEHGTFLPTFAKVRASDGKLFCRERPLMPGYLFFFLPDPGRWTEVKNAYGVFDVISNNEGASKVTDSEMCRMVMDHIKGTQNDIDITGLERQRRQDRGSRKPRASRRARAAA
jgi:transcription antitermination factor NusG